MIKQMDPQETLRVRSEEERGAQGGPNQEQGSKSMTVDKNQISVQQKYQWFQKNK